MLPTFGKCMCLYTGYWNDDAQYTVGGIVLCIPIKEQDIGLTMSVN